MIFSHELDSVSPWVLSSMKAPFVLSVQQTTDPENLAKNREGWQRVIDEKIIEWGRPENSEPDDDYDPPTGPALKSGLEIIRQMSDLGLLPPTRVVPDGDGGLVFELRNPSVVSTIHIYKNGEAENYVLQNGKVVFRSPLSL